MSYADEVYSDLERDYFDNKHAFEEGAKRANELKVFQDVSALLTKENTDHLSGNVKLVNGIMHTVYNKKRMSYKQKYVLYIFLVRNKKSYQSAHDSIMDERFEMTPGEIAFFDDLEKQK